MEQLINLEECLLEACEEDFLPEPTKTLEVAVSDHSDDDLEDEPDSPLNAKFTASASVQPKRQKYRFARQLNLDVFQEGLKNFLLRNL